MKRTEIIAIDGSAGEGGGQILRTSLALSLVTGQPFRAVNIRAGRARPGLLRQHLTAVQAAAQVGGASCDGAEIGSRELVFRPEGVRPGDYRFAIGTAGSTTLVLQTVLPALMLADSPSRLTLEGGTHNPFAPPFDFLARTFLPQLARFGPRVEAELIRPGFYPAGGGCVEVRIDPAARLSAVELRERGADAGRRAVAHLAALPAHVAERAFGQIETRLGWPREAFEVREYPSARGPGFALTLEAASEAVVEVCTGFGAKGRRVEQVADDAIDQMRRYLLANAPIGEYLTDQWLLPMALSGGGSFRSVGLTPHARTNMEVIGRFLPVRFQTDALETGGAEVSLSPR
jgi:RNA 3'-terminal phosphate cyclase (ATP)